MNDVTRRGGAAGAEWPPAGILGACLLLLTPLLVIYQVNMYSRAAALAEAMRIDGPTPGRILYPLLWAAQMSGAALVLLAVARSLLLARGAGSGPADSAPPVLANPEAAFLGPLLLIGLTCSQEIVPLDSGGARLGQGLYFGPLGAIRLLNPILVASVGVAGLLGLLAVSKRMDASGSEGAFAGLDGGLPKALSVAALAGALVLALGGLAVIPRVFAELGMDNHYELPSNLYRPACWWAGALALVFVARPPAGARSGRVGMTVLALPFALGLLLLLFQSQTLPGLWWSPVWKGESVPEYFVHDSGRIWDLTEHALLAALWSAAVAVAWDLTPRGRAILATPVAVGAWRKGLVAIVKFLSWACVVPLAVPTTAAFLAAIWLFALGPIPAEIAGLPARILFRAIGSIEAIAVAGQIFHAAWGWGRLTGVFRERTAGGTLRASLGFSCLLVLGIAVRMTLWALFAG